MPENAPSSGALAPEGISTFSATVNLAKLCVGIGILAIPFASVQGGVAFSPCCLAAVAAWNQLSVVMLVESKNRVIGRTEFPNGLASTYSKIAYHSFGWGGVYIIDLSVVATLLGVCVSYQMGFAQMLQQVLLSAEKLVAFSRYEVLIGLSAVLVTPLSCSRDLGMLSHASLLGLVALVVGVAFIFVYGLQVHNAERYEPLPLWPQDVAGVASFLGISTFCFGICALVLPIEESMSRRQDAPSAAFRALLLVWALYVVVGDGAAVLFVGDERSGGVQGNILQNLPERSLSATVARLLMAIACIVSYPVALMPVARIVDYLHATYLPGITGLGRGAEPVKFLELVKTDYEPVSQSASSSGGGEGGESSGTNTNTNCSMYFMIRFMLVALTSCLSLLSSNFATVIALIGCLSVSILSFAMPPAIHLRVVALPSLRRNRAVLLAASAHSLDHPPSYYSSEPHVIVDSRRGPIAVSLAEARRRVAYGTAICLLDFILCVAGCMLTVVATAVTLAST